MNHIVKLEKFEGPLDLLIHLIRTNEMDIYDIQIAHITDQYLEALKLMKDLNITIAGEYIYMAATLIYIKSRMLLPTEILEEEEEEDPRRLLVEKLLEYQMYSKVGEHLLKNSIATSNMMPVFIASDVPDRGFQRVNTFHLGQVFTDLVKNSTPHFHEVEMENYSVAEKIEEIKAILMPGKRVSFVNLYKKSSRMEGIVTFLALLELVKDKTLKIFQEDLLGLVEIMAVA
ncbi:MAG: segregation/condensation protein A [Deltaproteobacteria bacterium]|nr:segregation/condensation protein A [Deltaproteobacteria bacterium]